MLQRVRLETKTAGTMGKKALLLPSVCLLLLSVGRLLSSAIGDIVSLSYVQTAKW